MKIELKIIILVFFILLQGCSTFESKIFYSPSEEKGSLENEYDRYYVSLGGEKDTIYYKLSDTKISFVVTNTTSIVHSRGPIFLPVIPSGDSADIENINIVPSTIKITIEGEELSGNIDFSGFTLVTEMQSYNPISAGVSKFVGKHGLNSNYESELLGSMRVYNFYVKRRMTISLTYNINETFINKFMLSVGDTTINGEKLEVKAINFNLLKRKQLGIFSGPA